MTTQSYIAEKEQSWNSNRGFLSQWLLIALMVKFICLKMTSEPLWSDPCLAFYSYTCQFPFLQHIAMSSALGPLLLFLTGMFFLTFLSLMSLIIFLHISAVLEKSLWPHGIGQTSQKEFLEQLLLSLPRTYCSLQLCIYISGGLINVCVLFTW